MTPSAAFGAGVSGGSLQPMVETERRTGLTVVKTECGTSLTLDRVKALDSQCRCLDGDVACRSRRLEASRLSC